MTVRTNALDREGRMWTCLQCGPFETLEDYRTWLEPGNFDHDGRQRRSLAECREEV